MSSAGSTNNHNGHASLHKRDDSCRSNDLDVRHSPRLCRYSLKEDMPQKVPPRDPLAIEEISFASPLASPARVEREEYLPTLEESESSGLDYSEDRGASFRQEIQVSDGVYMTLRGSKETQAAYDHGLCIEATCFICDISLACVPDCDAVVCPQCRMVSPVESPASRTRFHGGGVGLGIML